LIQTDVLLTKICANLRKNRVGAKTEISGL